MTIDPEKRSTAKELLYSSDFLKHEIMKNGIKENPEGNKDTKESKEDPNQQKLQQKNQTAEHQSETVFSSNPHVRSRNSQRPRPGNSNSQSSSSSASNMINQQLHRSSVSSTNNSKSKAVK
jgi:hypothetical protein